MKLTKNPNDRTGALKRRPLCISLHPWLQNIKKLKNVPFGEQKVFEKNLNAEKKLKKGDTLGFFNIHSVAKHKELKRELFGEFSCRKKSNSAEKN